MPNKTQAKTSVDNAATSIKNDIDNTLPVGINIIDGGVTFGPTRWNITMDANHVSATADSWATSIASVLSAAGRNPVTLRRGRRSDDTSIGQEIIIQTTLAVYRIINAT